MAKKSGGRRRFLPSTSAMLWMGGIGLVAGIGAIVLVDKWGWLNKKVKGEGPIKS